MEYTHKSEYRVLHWKESLEDSRMMLCCFKEDVATEPFYFHSAMVLNSEKNEVYACTEDSTYTVQKYRRNDELNKWELVQDLPKSGADDVEVMLQLKLDKEEKILFGTTSNGFVIWDFNEDKPIAEDEAIVLQLPHGTRNISTKMLRSNSIMLSAHRNYAVGGIR